MALENVSQAGIAFIATLVLPFGFGKLLWSKHPSREWLAIASIALSIIFSVLSGFSAVLLYGGLMVGAQLVAKLLVLGLRKGVSEAEPKAKSELKDKNPDR